MESVNFRFGDRITLPEYSEWRSLFPVFRGDDLIAFLGNKNGWGKGWALYALKISDRALFEGFSPNTKDYNATITVVGKGVDLIKKRAVTALGETFDGNGIWTHRSKYFQSRNEILTKEKEELDNLAKHKAKMIENTKTTIERLANEHAMLASMVERIGNIVSPEELKLLQDLTEVKHTELRGAEQRLQRHQEMPLQ